MLFCLIDNPVQILYAVFFTSRPSPEYATGGRSCYRTQSSNCESAPARYIIFFRCSETGSFRASNVRAKRIINWPCNHVYQLAMQSSLECAVCQEGVINQAIQDYVLRYLDQLGLNRAHWWTPSTFRLSANPSSDKWLSISGFSMGGQFQSPPSLYYERWTWRWNLPQRSRNRITRLSTTSRMSFFLVCRVQETPSPRALIFASEIVK